MWLAIFLVFFLLLVYAVIKDRRPSNCPPGPMEIPFFGRIPIADEKNIDELRKKYGDVVMYRSGNMRKVYMFDADIVKEVMARPEFANRPECFSVMNQDEKKIGGVAFNNGAPWQHDRRFVLRNLRDLGMGKSYMDEALATEAKALVEDLRKYNGEAINHPISFHIASLNIIWQMVASTRFDMRSKELETVFKIIHNIHTKLGVMTFLPFFIPSLYRLPKFIKDPVFKVQAVQDYAGEMKSVALAAIEQHLEDYSPENPKDLINEYIKEMKESEGDENSYFRKGALTQIVSDLFLAGSDSVDRTLKWVNFLLAKYPNYAKRMQEEIDEVVPKDRMVSLNDKPRLPLVEAFVVETLRYSSLAITSLERSAAKDTTIKGYFIPKDTIVQIANYSIHHDPRYWDEPDKFYPERFLDASGTKFTAPKQAFFAFGSGRRQCVGEQLARMELFLFSAAIIQNFDVLPGPGVDLSVIETENLISVLVPADKKLVFKPRI